MGRSRSRIQRAKSYRWEIPEPEAVTIDAEGRQRWDEARAKSIAWAVEAARDPRVVYLDTETTGFGPRAEIVDIGVVDAGGEVIFESLVRPERSIPREVIAIHGITDADVRDAPRWDELYDHLAPVLKDRRILVYKVIAGGVRRGPAEEARKLFEDMSPPPAAKEDTPASFMPPLREAGSGRPTKRERRETDRLRRPDDE